MGTKVLILAKSLIQNFLRACAIVQWSKFSTEEATSWKYVIHCQRQNKRSILPLKPMVTSLARGMINALNRNRRTWNQKRWQCWYVQDIWRTTLTILKHSETKHLFQKDGETVVCNTSCSVIMFIQVEPFALATNFATMWRHFHYFKGGRWGTSLRENVRAFWFCRSRAPPYLLK